MKPNGNETHEAQMQNQTSRQVTAPEAAAKSEVERAESKADEAREKAESAQERIEVLEEQNRELQEKNEKLATLAGRVIGAIHRIDQHLTSVDENIGAWGNSYTTEDIADMYDLPKSNVDFEEIGSEDNSESSGGEDIDIPSGWGDE